MEKNVLPKFDCFSDPGTIGPQWKRWLTYLNCAPTGKDLL